jgi:hypothetical protein
VALATRTVLEIGASKRHVVKRFRIESTLVAAGLIVFITFFVLRRPQPDSEPPLIASARSVSEAQQQISTSQIVPVNESSLPGSQPELLPRHDLRWEQSPPEPAFARFAEWVIRYRAAERVEKIALEAEGIELARERRHALRDLIKADAARALALTLPLGLRRSLPDAVTLLLEGRVSGRGSLAVFGALAAPGFEDKVTPTFRIASIDDVDYQAFVYGRRLGQPSHPNLPLSGIALDDLLAVDENPIRLLEPEEVDGLNVGPAEPLCVVSGNLSSIGRTQVAAEVAGELIFFCAPAHAARRNEELMQAEVAGDSGAGGAVQANAATEGTKRLLLIRVDFADLAGTPFADDVGVTIVNGLNQFYRESSFGRSGFAPCLGMATNSGGSDVTPTFRMPQTASHYGGNDAYLQLRTDARNAAAAAGYVLGNYDYDLYCFGAVPGFQWAGLGYIGAPGVWLRGYFTSGVAGHELGHNYGLNHANFWDTGGQSVIGAGESIEYGDSFDTMGSANAGAFHFNARYKSYMGWLKSGETLTVTTSGVYRVFAHDDANSTGLRGLRIARNSSTNYWVEFRQKFMSNPWLMSGAGIHWAGNGNERSHLLDTTPGSPDGRNDSALVVGRTFSDRAAGIHITTLRKAATTPESLDIAIHLGTFPDNIAPMVVVNASGTSTVSGSPLTFSAAASDTNGDSLAYHWDFGDNTFGTNGAIASKSWPATGEYLVRCVVSDMKGGVASDSAVVTVNNPATYQIRGQVSVGGAPIQGVRVSVSSVKMTYTDSDGTYVLPGLPAGSYTVSAALDGYSFAQSGFVNPVGVGPNANGVDFNGVGGVGAVLITSPANNSVYTAPANLFLAANATAANGKSISKIEFFQGATKLGQDAAFPYGLAWNNAPAGNYTLSARATDSAGLVATSAPVAIVVHPAAPVITSHPQSQTVTAEANVSFGVIAVGSATLTYRWRFNGANLAGANGATLSLFNVQSPQAGAYSVVITNQGGAVTSSVANLTVTCGFALSQNTANFSSVGGLGSVVVTSQGGCAWGIGNIPVWIAITSGNGGTGNGTVSYSVAPNSTGGNRTAILVIGGHNFTITQGVPDLVRPTVAISFPPANALLTNSQLTVNGTASDNDAVLRVDCWTGSGAVATAAGSGSWSAPITLSPGTNTISVRSVDVSGNTSAVSTRTVFCAIPGTLILGVNGQGLVKGATNGQSVHIGRLCKLTALPVSGFVFSNWTGDVSGVSPTLTFLMRSNLAVTANFVTNPFVTGKGQYSGLFYQPNEVRVGSAGFFTLTLTYKGAYSALLHLAGRKFSIRSRLSLDGRATNTVERSGMSPLRITWAVGLDGSDQIVGTVSDDSWTAQLWGDRKVFNASNPAPHTGKYTMLLLGSPDSTLAPEGDGYGVGTVDRFGRVSLKGALADNTPFAIKGALSQNGQWPVFTPLYQGKGVLLGWAAFSDAPTTDWDGVMSWIKPSSTATLYPAGFSAEAALVGSRYTPPVSATYQLLALTNTVVVLTGGNLSQASTNTVLFGGNGKVINVGSNQLALTFTSSSGLFTGSFTPSGGTATVSFKGVVFQKGNYGSGYHVGTNQSGRVNVSSGSSSPVGPIAPEP